MVQRLSLVHLMDAFSFSAETRGQGLLHASEVSYLHSLVGLGAIKETQDRLE